MTDLLRRWAQGDRKAPRLLVVGGASLDILDVSGIPTPSAGGSGLYTSLAAARAGASVTMLAPRPDPMPKVLAPADRFIRWVGPPVAPDDLPHFEIAYQPNGDVGRFESEMGAEPDLRPHLIDDLDDLPAMAFCVPFLDASLQLAFVEDLARRGCLTVANTYSCAARSNAETVRRTAAAADVFFCNESEAGLLFGSIDAVPCRPGQIVFVTRGADGATVIQGSLHTRVPAPPAEVVDPTGAGDTFCGTVMAHLASGAHPVEAARHGVAAASRMVEGVGPSLLIEDAGDAAPAADERARVDIGRVAAMASLLSGLDRVEPFDFTGDVFPEVGDPGALDFFFSATLQQFGFWSTSDGHYGRPTYATIDGTRHKGSDYLWAAYLRWMRTEPGALPPQGQAAVTPERYAAALAEDGGGTPLPALDLHASLAADYGASLAQLGAAPADLLEVANRSDRPLATLLRLLDHVGGYREDPLRKKSALLAIILQQRPEAWLHTAAGDDSPPIVDYHIQRTSLRTGMVVADGALRSRLAERRVIEAEEEAAVRRAAYAAVAQLGDL
ncbi:MAG: carbohydrate kinase family protein, partial [Acidimicrobiia bacterium]|nr:carbohydrate kinase family protein [Acidimicrobiia bacterium]